MSFKKIIPFFMLVFLLASCKVEFSPNQQWENIPVVYCVLDQGDDTTYLRLQRCFLGEGNQYRFLSNPDSNYYPVDAVSITMEEWNAWVDNTGTYHINGDAPRKVFSFKCSEPPVYYCETKNALDTAYIYRLIVKDSVTGKEMARGETVLVRGRMQLSKPNNITLFQFSGVAGSKTCDITWSALPNARQYQPVVRFFYRDFIINRDVIPFDTIITPHYIDIPCGTLKSDLTERHLTLKLSQNTFLSVIANALVGDTVNKNIIDTVQIFVNSCNEDLAAYLYATNPSGTFSQEPFVYTNIEGGLGIFASRRTHISFRVPSPGSSQSDYKKRLKELGVGF